MQHTQGRIFSSLVAIGLTMAALMAPPSVFADTVSTGGTSPAPAPAPAPAPPAVPGQPVSPVRVGLGRSLTAADVSAPGGLYVVGDGAFQLQTAPGQLVHLALSGAQIQVTGLTKAFTSIRLVPVPPPAPAGTGATGSTAPAVTPTPAAPTLPPAPANPVTYNGVTYRGEIAVVVTRYQKLSVVNVVNVEEYVAGVISREMPPGWHVEAQKAQAVASRTYALRHIGNYADEGFDLVPTTIDQEYRGIAAETGNGTKAVTATLGQVLTYDGNLISAMYHSSSGGYTENNEIIYAGGTPVAYLRGEPDYDNVAGNSNFSWQKLFTIADFTRYLKNRGVDVGTISSVTPAGAMGVSGRPSQWQITGSGGVKQLSGQDFRTALGLLSSPRTVTVQPGGLTPATRTFAQTESFFVMGAGGVVQQRSAVGASIVAAGGTRATVAGAVTTVGAAVSQPGGFLVAGGGSGHGVGMSQWGAYGMALQGKPYTEILAHYYQGTTLETRPTQ